MRQLRRFELREPPQERNRLEGDEESRPLEVSPAFAAFKPLGVHDGEAADCEPGIAEAEAAPGVVVDPAESRVEVEDLRPGWLGRVLGRGGRAGCDDEEPREQRGAGGPAPGPAPVMGPPRSDFGSLMMTSTDGRADARETYRFSIQM